jgi:uncharacterized protein (DUF2141 family)
MKMSRFARSRRAQGLLARQALAKSVARSRPAAVEPLEDRQLLSLTIDLRVAGAANPKVASVTSVGQTITLQEWATITGSTTATTANDEVWDSYGSVISTKSGSGSVDGKMSAASVTSYAYNQQPGKVQDLNGDGNLDVGSNNPANVEDYVFVRAPHMPGTLSGNSVSYELATFTYTVTSLSQGAPTSIGFVLPSSAPGGGYSAVWYQDGVGHNSTSDSTGYQVGAPVTISDSSIKPAVGKISGTVTKSVNGSTSAFSGVTVYLDINDAGSYTSGDPTSVTSSTGAYSFSNLAQGPYYLRELVPTGYNQTAPSSTPTLINIAGNDSYTINFTDTAAAAKTGSISGTVYKAGSSTVGFAGVTVYLDNNNDGVFDSGDTSVVTTSSGSYNFSGLTANTYHLREVVPSGYKQTAPTTTPTNVVLSAGGVISGQNFTDTPTTTSPGSISGNVYNDKNSNGKLDSGEAGIANVLMYLDLKKDGKIDAGDPTFTTNSAGAFSITGLAPGTYRLREVVLSGYKVTNPSASYFDVSVASGAAVKNENFYNHITTASGVILSGNVFSDLNSSGVRDLNEPGLSNWTVYLDLNNNGKLDPGENTKVTDSYGNFSFVSLKAGTYYVRVVPQSGYSLTAPSGGFIKLTLVAGTPSTAAFAEHQTGATTATGNGSGSGSSSQAITVSGNVFADLNGNGVQDAGEKGLSGWGIYVDLNNSGKYVAGDNGKVTDANGNFTFNSLKPGTYIIRVIPETGYTESAPSSGFFNITVAAGSVVTGLDFGEKA